MNRFYILFFILCSTGIQAQEAHIVFNKLNMGVYNPAFTGTQGSYVSLNSRAQWSGVKDAPRTNYLLYYLPKKKNVHIGFTAQNDRVFIENKTHFTIDYNYELKLGEVQKIFLGIKGGGFYNNIDLDRLTRLTALNNPALTPVESYFTPILGVGIQLQMPNYFIGLGIPNILTNKRFEDGGGIRTEASDAPYYYFSGGATFNLNKTFALQPILVYRSIPNSPNILTATFELEYEKRFTGGVGFSNNNNLAFFFSTKSIKNIELGYGYEFMNRGDSTAIQGGSHEIMLRFSLKKEPEEIPIEDGNKETK